MSEIIQFPFKERPIRVVLDEAGNPWFVAQDVCRELGLDLTKVGRTVGPDERGRHQVPTLGGTQQMTVISESGLYKLVLRSDKPEAKELQDWVAREVLPSIRKTGGYLAPGAQSTGELLRQNSQQLAQLTELIGHGFVQIAGRMDKFDQRLEDVERRLPDRRMEPASWVRPLYAKIIHKRYDGFCACGCGRRIVDEDGDPTKDFVIDHKEGRGQNAPHQLWAVHKSCNERFKKEPRSHLRMAMFEEHRREFDSQLELFRKEVA